VYGVDRLTYVCPRHGNDGTLDVLYHYDQVDKLLDRATLAGSSVRSMWRYLALLPVDGERTQRLVEHTMLASVGWTPLYGAPRLAASLGLSQLWVKDDSRQPTASLKDRASAIAVVKTRELGYEVVTTASTGNAGAALAGLCAAVDQDNVIFVPRSAPEAKIAQLLVYGATVLLVDGSYDEAFDLCLEAAAAFGWYNRNTGYNPYMTEGKKTVAYEIWEQMGSSPDAVFVPVGDGSIIGGVHKGFRDLLALDWIERMPRIYGVQAAGSAALVDAWERGIDATEMEPIHAHTLADSICSGLPRDRVKALRAVRESGGAYVRVSDEAIVNAILTLARDCGVFAEPAAAAAYAGVAQAAKQGLLDPGERVVLLVTGSGLKDPAAATSAVPPPAVILPTLDAVQQVMNGAGGRILAAT